MFDAFLFQILPYIAAVVCVSGVIYRFVRGPIGVSSLSSQFLEGETIRWGSGPWHLGIIALLAGHILPLLTPGFWSTLLQIPGFLLAVEVIGLALGFLAAGGLVVLIFRRLGNARIRAVTSKMDTLVLFLLLAQVVLGLSVALGMRWGAAWAPGVLAPYILSLATLQPDITTLAGMGWVMHAHIIGAWLLLGLVPFSRLTHAFSIPLAYPARPHQKVVWANPRSRRASRSL